MRNAAFTAVILAGIAATTGALTGCRNRAEQEKIALPLPQGTPKRPQGMTALTVNPNAPEPFTKNDVTNYFATHGLPRLSPTPGQFQVDKLEFLTSKQVSDRLQGVSTGLADNDRIGFATLVGTFIVSSPKSAKSGTYVSAYAAFDAASGNLLMEGTLESGKGSSPNQR